MKVLFFGDSFTSGENNHYDSYVEKLQLERGHFSNFGESGTTYGNYSLYPVDSFSFLAQIEKHKVEIHDASIICFEYGINDATSNMLNVANNNMILISIIKCIDYIRQLNPKAKLIYLQVAENKKILEELAKAQIKYIYNEYLNNIISFFDSSISVNNWIKSFETQAEIIKRKVDKTIVLIDDVDFMKKYIDVDAIHPNDNGYQIIADKIKKEI